MSRATLLNACGVTLALALSVLAAQPGPSEAVPAAAAPDALEVADVEPAARIASASTVADALLLELCASSRIVAITARSAGGPDGHRFEGLATIRTLDDVEAIVALSPEVLVAHNVADPARVARLREAGVEVLDLGALEGRATLGEDARVIGALCGAPEAGARWAATFERRMDAVAPAPDGRRAIYLTAWGDRYMGGADGTSYHDVIVAAGLEDAAAEAYDGWPTYDVEELLAIDPDLVVTRAGMGRALCAHATLRRLRACPGGVIELDPDLLDDPGPGMLDAAEALRDRISAAGSSE